ncbi:ABC transporter permease [Heliorestis convoluta]|uniref:ABC-2 transporter family protein n=1 Tax=Heliorestis convoluta TaxID=356322 RepID=A0A5Q2N104_9FIRM|nr:ABC transporter permease [Heliorestis convoluta]QGG46972.1 ABC-2 transporter family protein [Heliorestis convoluta]
MNRIVLMATKEFLHILRDKRSALFLLVGPLVALLFFTFLYAGETVGGLRLLIVDEDKSPLSREIASQYSQVETFEYVGQVNHYDQAREWLQSGKAEVAVIIPSNFSKEIKEGRGSQILTIIDGTNMLVSNSAIRASSQIVQYNSALVTMRVLESHGIPLEKAKSIVQSVNFSTRVWYNPTFNYRNFLLLGLAATVLQQVLLMPISTSICREKTRGTNAYLALSPLRSYEAIIGKAIPYIFLGLFNLLLILVFANRLGIGIRGSGLEMFILSFLFALSLVGIAFIISLVAKDELRATQMSVLVAMPSFLISGFTWPLDGMAQPIVWVAQALPLTHFLEAIKIIGVKGAGIENVGTEIGALSLLGFGGIAGTILLWEQKRKKGKLL